ncbi:MAG: MBL fold metallo-hydrolase [Patescibacteria group bacterium]
MKLTFYGGARSVTGANYLLETGGTKILVDCGMFQGSKYSEDLNYEKFPYDPSEIDFVFVTHSHTDHSGRLPKLHKEGFRGKLIATDPALDLIKKALPDNLNLIKQESEQAGHEPLFSIEDLEGVLGLASGVNYGEEINLGDDLKAVLHDAGHILGSSIIELEWSDHSKSGLTTKIYFSGDLGNPPTPLLPEPYFPKDADYAVIESAYGSRTHEDKAERKQILANLVKETVTKGGTLMIPSFAMERTQELLYELNDLIENNKVSRVPIFVDSPLATNLTEVYRKYPDYFNKKAMYLIDSGDDIFNFPGLQFTRTTDESKKINDVRGPKVIIAGSGMSNGGRILHHEKRYLPDPNSAILFVGYQVKGSLGRQILDGEKEVKIFGEKIPVNCKVEAVGGYSAHADQNMLLKWVTSAAEGGKLKKVFVVQGEEDSSLALARKIERTLKIDAIVPRQGESFSLNSF